MTSREREILNIIKENPMISQKDLAARTGISRSSVAVHISNLIGKGAILGKGYVVNEESYIVVIGGANIDIWGKPFEKIVAQDSNPGTVSYTVGGVGRNIAHNLSLLNQNVKLITAFGGDANAEVLKSACVKAKIDLHDSLSVANAATSSYLFITDEKGEMQLAVSDMDVLEYITADFLASKLNLINNAVLCVIDTNIPQKTIEYIAENVTVPIFADPVSTAKTKKLKNVLHSIHTLKPNRLEAEILTGIKIDDRHSLEKAAAKLIDEGVKNLYLSLGGDGVYFKSETEEFEMPCFRTDTVNTTGAGDTFTASVAYAFRNGFSSINSAKLGLAGSAICIEANETVSPRLSEKNLMEKAGLTEV